MGLEAKTIDTSAAITKEITMAFGNFLLGQIFIKKKKKERRLCLQDRFYRVPHETITHD